MLVCVIAKTERLTRGYCVYFLPCLLNRYVIFVYQPAWTGCVRLFYGVVHLPDLMDMVVHVAAVLMDHCTLQHWWGCGCFLWGCIGF